MTMPARSGCSATSSLAQQHQRLPVGEIDRGAGDVAVAHGQHVGDQRGLRPARDDLVGVHHDAGGAVVLQVERPAPTEAIVPPVPMNATFGFMHDGDGAGLGRVQHRRTARVEVGVALIGVGHLQHARLGERPRGDLQADRQTVRIEAAVHADRRQAEIVVWPRVGRDRHERHLGARRAVVDVGLGQRRQAGADGRRDQHIDLGEHLAGERLQDRTAAASAST